MLIIAAATIVFAFARGHQLSVTAHSDACCIVLLVNNRGMRSLENYFVNISVHKSHQQTITLYCAHFTEICGSIKDSCCTLLCYSFMIKYSQQ